MAYGQLRFLYDNRVTSLDMITPGSQATGIVSGGQKTIGTESAILVAVGSYSGAEDLLYTVQIDSTTPGVSVGQATFRWRTSETASGWEASGVTTSSTLLTLNYGVKIAWQSGDGNDFAVGNTWIFNANAIFGPGRLIDHERNTIFRTGSTYTVVIDLGSAQQITAFALLDHNVTTGGTFTLQANTSDSWGSPAYSQVVTIQDPMYLYLDETYRYWRLVPVDGAISYFEAGELFLGQYTELEKCNADWGAVQTNGYVLYSNNSYTGLQRRKAYAKQRKLNLSFPLTSNTDIDTITTMQDALVDLETGEVNPLLVHLYYDEADKLYYMDWDNINAWGVEFFRVGWNNMTMQFTEQVKSRI